jgi:hypothetical protein
MKQLITTTAALLLVFGASAYAGSATSSSHAAKQNSLTSDQSKIETTGQTIATNTKVKKHLKGNLLKKSEDKSEFKN